MPLASTVLSCDLEIQRELISSGSQASPQNVCGIRPLGIPRPLGKKCAIYRSRELYSADSETIALLLQLGVKRIFDLRNVWEIEKSPDPRIPGIDCVRSAPQESHIGKDAGARLRAGTIAEYGKPGERMVKMYRRFAVESTFLANTLRELALCSFPALIHCKNGKDRCGVVAATILRIAGCSYDSILHDYLLTNTVNKASNSVEFYSASGGMTLYEEEILLSFYEARPSYLSAFFASIDDAYGSFDGFVTKGLGLDEEQIAKIASMALGACGIPNTTPANVSNLVQEAAA